MKYKIQKHDEKRFMVHLTTDVEDIMKRLADEISEEVVGQTPMGMVKSQRITIIPRKNLEGVEEVAQTSRYSFTVLVGVAFDNFEVIKGVMNKLDCDLDMEEDEFETDIELIEDSNGEFMEQLNNMMKEALESRQSGRQQSQN